MGNQSADLPQPSATETGAVGPATTQPDFVRSGSSDHNPSTEPPFAPARNERPTTPLYETLGKRRLDDVKMLKFDPRKFDGQAAKDIRDQERWFKDHWGDTDAARQSLAYFKGDIASKRAWLETYSGRISSRWGESWMVVAADIENPDVGLWADEINAAIEYPLWHIPSMLGEKRLLTPAQLSKLATQRTMLQNTVFEDEIAKAQLQMGLNPQSVEAAVALNRSARSATTLPAAPTTPQV